ncbi:MAG: histone H1 [Planctomycetia bacterium]|nr:histone H1 [Planctomycetia bacterium]
MQAYENLRQLIDSCHDDVQKAAGGNKAAGTRVRKVMQEVREAAKHARHPHQRRWRGHTIGCSRWIAA